MGIPEELPHTMASWKFRGTMPPTSLHDVKISNTGQQIREPSVDGTDVIPVIATDIYFTFDSRTMIYLLKKTLLTVFWKRYSFLFIHLPILAEPRSGGSLIQFPNSRFHMWIGKVKASCCLISFLLTPYHPENVKTRANSLPFCAYVFANLSSKVDATFQNKTIQFKYNCFRSGSWFSKILGVCPTLLIFSIR